MPLTLDTTNSFASLRLKRAILQSSASSFICNITRLTQDTMEIHEYYKQLQEAGKEIISEFTQHHGEATPIIKKTIEQFGICVQFERCEKGDCIPIPISTITSTINDLQLNVEGNIVPSSEIPQTVDIQIAQRTTGFWNLKEDKEDLSSFVSTLTEFAKTTHFKHGIKEHQINKKVFYFVNKLLIETLKEFNIIDVNNFIDKEEGKNTRAIIIAIFENILAHLHLKLPRYSASIDLTRQYICDHIQAQEDDKTIYEIERSIKELDPPPLKSSPKKHPPELPEPKKNKENQRLSVDTNVQPPNRKVTLSPERKKQIKEWSIGELAKQ